MTLSLEKMPGFGLETEPSVPAQIDLIANTFVTRDGTPKPFDPEHWPVMIFLKGLGCENIQFHIDETAILQNWIQRIANYQQSYLFDPENFRIEECQWNESDEAGNVLIECQIQHKHPRRDHLHSIITVPPLEAPLGVDPDTVKKFVDEVARQSPQEILLRVHSILKEYEKDSKNKDPELWGALIADVVAVALEAKFLDKAIEISETHQATMETLWTQHPERVLRLFSAYDPKGAELFSWSRIFSTFKNSSLLKSYESYLSTPAGPQILKLLNYRIQNKSDEMIEICFQENSSVQKHLLPWLTPHWREKHFESVFAQLEQRADESLTRLWLLALARSSLSRTLLAIERFFPKRSFWEKITADHHFQKIILSVLAEHPTMETIEFIRKIKNRLSGKLAGQAETILSSYHKAK